MWQEAVQMLLLLLQLAAQCGAQPTLWPFSPPAAWREANHVYLGGLFPLTGRNAEGGKQREAGEALGVAWEFIHAKERKKEKMQRRRKRIF